MLSCFIKAAACTPADPMIVGATVTTCISTRDSLLWSRRFKKAAITVAPPSTMRELIPDCLSTDNALPRSTAGLVRYVWRGRIRAFAIFTLDGNTYLASRPCLPLLTWRPPLLERPFALLATFPLENMTHEKIYVSRIRSMAASRYPSCSSAAACSREGPACLCRG